MHLNHPMPFGAAVQPDGEVQFRLWAPAARQVSLCLESPHNEVELSMPGEADGWFSLSTGKAQIGERYRFRIDDGMRVPDPASRYQPDDVHGPSQIVDPSNFDWQDTAWRGRPWHEAVLYELHIGTFTPEGTFKSATDKLEHLAELGITAIELMPISDFPGKRDWGYDGVLPFAPDAAYGTPDELKAFIQAAHARNIMVLLDVVYNHFGPEGNYLHVYAKPFFTEKHHTPWGAAINFDDEHSRIVRDFFIHNALFWLEEYRFDGLRLDAVHAILDDSPQHILDELAEAVQAGPGRNRHVHLILENEDNQTRFLEDIQGRDGHKTPRYAAQWNDDIHHVFHVLLSGEKDGYYSDYAVEPARLLARCLSEGFAWQGEPSPFKHGERRGEISAHLPPQAFVNFLQNHDQIGNRAFGERLTQLAPADRLRAATTALLLCPAPPLLFMGEEFGARTPFQFFCDFGPDLRSAVREGRRREFARFERFSDPAVREQIPDPGDINTAVRSTLDWACLEHPAHRDGLNLHTSLLTIRHRELTHRLEGCKSSGAEAIGKAAVRAAWKLNDGSELTLLLNLGETVIQLKNRPAGRLMFSSRQEAEATIQENRLPGDCASWFLDGVQ